MKYIHQGYILTVFQYSFNVVNFSNHINIHILHVSHFVWSLQKCKMQVSVYCKRAWNWSKDAFTAYIHGFDTFAEFEYFSFQLQWNKFVQWDQVFTITPISEEVCVPKFGSLET